MNKSVGWLVVLIVAAMAIAIGFLLPYLAPGQLYAGKGLPAANPFVAELPSILVWAGTLGMVVGFVGIARARRSWRRLSVVSAVNGGLALLLLAPLPNWGFLFGYPGIWLGGLLSVAAIGTAIGAFVRPMPKKALDIPLAVFGVLAGIPCALWALWILGLTIGGGLGE